jgi:hypothetical protein
MRIPGHAPGNSIQHIQMRKCEGFELFPFQFHAMAEP